MRAHSGFGSYTLTVMEGNIPRPTPTLQPFATVSAGNGEHTCGVTTSGAAYCWGEGVYGRLGDGSVRIQFTPVAVWPPVSGQ